MDVVNSPLRVDAPAVASGRSSPFANLPIRAKLIVTFLLITAISAGVITYFSARTVSDQLTAEVGASLKNTATQSGLAVGDFLNRQVGQLSAFSLSKIVQDEVEKANAAYPAGADVQATIEGIDKQWIAAQGGDPLIRDRLTSPVASELQEYRSSFPDNVEVFVTDKYGALVAATNRTSDYYQADEDWWKRAWNNGQGGTYIGQPTFDESARVLSLTIAIPLYGHGSQEVIGILRSTFRLDQIIKQLDNVRIGATGQARLFLTEAQYLAPDQKTVEFDPQQLSLILAAPGNMIETSYLNAPSLVSSAPVTTIDKQAAIAELGWNVLVNQSRDESLAPVSAVQQTILLTSLATLLLASLLALLLAQSISAPLKRLTNNAQRIAAGDLDLRLGFRRRDEIGQLGASFDSMAESLQQQIASEQAAREEAEYLQGVEAKNRQTLEQAVTEYLGFVQHVARGDLSQRLAANYDGALGQLASGLNGMVASLHTITAQVQEGTNAIAAAVAQISAATAEQAASSAEQSAAITETATAVEEVKTIALQTAEQANHVAASSQSAMLVARDGNQMVAEAVTSMGLIRQQVGQIAHTINGLSGHMRSISTIITSVSELADQINNLARNAAIESTRSGQQDKDLDGLARLVRDLAEQARTATSQVRQILIEIQRSSKAAAEVTEEGTRQVESGTRLITQAGEVIFQIANEMEKGAQSNVQMAAASHQQMLGMEQIGQAMVAIQQATGQALVGTRQAEQAAQDLQNLAHSLQQAITVYRL